MVIPMPNTATTAICRQTLKMFPAVKKFWLVRPNSASSSTTTNNVLLSAAIFASIMIGLVRPTGVESRVSGVSMLSSLPAIRVSLNSREQRFLSGIGSIDRLGEFALVENEDAIRNTQNLHQIFGDN